MTKGASVITMTYTADGEKLTKAVTGGGATKNYVAGIEYAGANLEAIYFVEGRCTPNGATAFNYDYTVKDHLGSARVNFRANGTTITSLESMHYYPFGMLMEGMGTNTPANDYTYNYKELNDDFGLNLYDYGARWYDASVGRWWSVDPMGAGMPDASLYNYVNNSPLNTIDPTGLWPASVNGVMARERAEIEKYNDQANQNSDDNARRNIGKRIEAAFEGRGDLDVMCDGVFGNARTDGMNFIVVADKQLRKDDIKSHGGWFNSAYAADYLKARIMSVLSLGKLKVITANSACEAVEKITEIVGENGYIDNLTIDFHAGKFGSQRLNDSGSDLSKLSKQGLAGKFSSVYLGQCWAGGNPGFNRVDNTSMVSGWLGGAKTYGQQSAASSLTFFFLNHFSGQVPDYKESPDNKSRIGFHTVSVNGYSWEIKGNVKRKNSGKIHEKK
jgi:RHS repeat-associated protein